VKFCLVTGCNGFVGSALTKSLLKKGVRVRGFDIREPKIDFGENFDFFIGDITKLEQVRSAMKGVDSVFHVAAVLVKSGRGSSYLFSFFYVR